ncbi:MAG TPA: GNAT family N-acetyltransferase [Kofleriaceae bacterium]|jgi:GNAT superfamily N-acetyltransferase
MIIREASEADLPGILAIYAQPELDAGDVMSLDEARAYMQRLRAYPSYKLYVADDAGTIVGTFALLVMDNLAHRGAPSAIVEDVGVAPELQGRGIGKQMMQHAMKLAADAGCYKLALSSNGRRTAAHAFYESLGFAQHGLSFAVGLPQAGIH